MGTLAKTYPNKICPVCGATFNRARYGKKLEAAKRYLARRTCSQACANTKETVTKDALHWRARKHKAKTCSECRTTEQLHVHHVDRNPANNDPANLRTLCASCHLKLHWQEDRDRRMATNPFVAAKRGASSLPPSTVMNA